MNIKKNGTPFVEEIEIDGKNNVDVYRVPPHRDVDGADFYHDFKMVIFFFPYFN